MHDHAAYNLSIQQRNSVMHEKHHDLTGHRVAVLAADGFEMVELAVPVAALRWCGAQVDVVSLRHGRIRGVNLHEPARRVRVSKTLAEVRAQEFDSLLLPGGFINPDLLRQSAAARDFVRAFDQARKPIATLCHGPWVLASAGLTRGRTLTSWPGIRDDLVNAGATWLDQEVVYDGNWVSSRGPQDMHAFVRGMLTLFTRSTPPSAITPQQTGSSPQRNDPPQLVVAAMTWLPRPSLRTAAGLTLLALWGLNRTLSKSAARRPHHVRG
ncbi:MAG: intracellular protease, PfpI family [Gammaproteobacteria bacterium]|nr:intracellular protease, PfpI family [Gammaproteobacteria bacterium]